MINEESHYCKEFDKKLCSVYDKRGKFYEDCMLRTQRKFDKNNGTKDMKEFCIDHYGN